MSTPSVIGYGKESEYKGIYVHFDGMPGEMIPKLNMFVGVFGFERFKQTIDEHPEGIVNIELENILTNRRLAVKYMQDGPGYQSLHDRDYGYIITPKTIECYYNGKKIKKENIMSDKHEAIRIIFKIKM